VCAAFPCRRPPAPLIRDDGEPPPDEARQQAITAVATRERGGCGAEDPRDRASTLDAQLDNRATPPSAPPTTAPAPATPSSASWRSRARRRRFGRVPAPGSGSGSGFGAGSSRAGGGGSSTSPSAADLVAYQSEVDAAGCGRDGTAVARPGDDLSPLAGTVVAVNMKIGDQVIAASSTENIVVQGAGGYEVTTSVSVDEIRRSRGQAASVVPDGTHTPLSGKVVAISVAPAPASTTSTSTAAIGLSGRALNGATGTVVVTDGRRPPRCPRLPSRRRHAPLREPHVSRSVTRAPVQVGVVGTMDRDHERPVQGTAGGARRRVGASELGDCRLRPAALAPRVAADASAASVAASAAPGGGGGGARTNEPHRMNQRRSH
jgi:hypothetical protein